MTFTGATAGGASAVVGMIWAQDLQGVIGRDGDIPWHLPEDLARFKKVTFGHPVIMGRRTWESFPAAVRPLPGRTNIVLTRRADWSDAGAVRAGTLPEALAAAAAAPGGDAIWIIGGQQLFQEALSVADTAAVTVVDLDAGGDTFAPRLTPGWVRVDSDPPSGPGQPDGWAESRTGLRYRYETWRREEP